MDVREKYSLREIKKRGNKIKSKAEGHHAHFKSCMILANTCTVNAFCDLTVLSSLDYPV